MKTKLAIFVSMIFLTNLSFADPFDAFKEIAKELDKSINKKEETKKQETPQQETPQQETKKQETKKQESQPQQQNLSKPASDSQANSQGDASWEEIKKQETNFIIQVKIFIF